MQLILETEATADISVKMSTVEESLDITLKDTIVTLCNGYKENIESPKNITNTVDDIDADHKEQSDIQPKLQSSAQDTTLELEVTNDDNAKSTAEDLKIDLEKDSTGEEVANNENSYDKININGIHNNGNVNGDRQKCQENSLVEDNKAEAENILVKEVFADKTEEISASSEKNIVNVDMQPEKLEENEENSNKEDNSNNIDVVAKVSSVLDAEMKTDDKKDNLDDSIKVLENETSLMLDHLSNVDEDISEMALEVDKTISDMSMQIDEDILEEEEILISESIQKEAILNDKTESENVSLNAEVASKDIVHIKPNLDVEVLPEKTTDVDMKNIDSTNELPTEVLDSSEQGTSDVVASIEKVANTKESEDIVPIKSEKTKNESLSKKTDDIVSKTGDPLPTKPSDSETKDAGDKPDANTPETEVPVLTEASVSDFKTDTLDDDVIQIESEQEEAIGETDNEVVDVPESIVNDAHDVDTDQAMTDLSTSVAIQSSEMKPEKIKCDLVPNESIQNTDDKVEVLDVDEIPEETKVEEQTEVPKTDGSSKSVNDKSVEVPILKLSNTLDILSDDDEEQPQTEPQKTEEPTPNQKQCINIEDDDDIMLIDEDTDLSKVNKTEPAEPKDATEKQKEKSRELTIDLETKKVDEIVADSEKVPVAVIPDVKSPSTEPKTIELVKETKELVKEPLKPLLPENFLKSCKKNLADMTREELEEFCILKIVESIVDRSNLGEIKSKLKLMAQNIDEHKKKAMMLTKQNRDLQLVLKSVQEEQKKKPDSAITPLKITRSVGMQVLMTEKIGGRKKPNTIIPLAPPSINRNIRTPNPSPRAQKQVGNQQIPVPRLVPAAANPVAKSPMTLNSPINNQIKTPNQFNGARMSPPVQKAEKRPHNRLQSVTVDLTDDEPPAKVTTPRSSTAPPVRLVSPQNLLASAAPRPQVTTSVNSPRKVYIPISGPQGQNIRPGQTIMLKSVSAAGPRHRSAVPTMTRGPAPSIIKRVPSNRHPAPLPDAMKQYQPPNWKALPPAPDLKLSKVENGIVISWKIEGYQEDSYEEIASYQLYAYQETSSPPSTNLWKKIGDVKALPLPMACTLTQFMAGFKYYFAVRAVDVRSRLGPFSLPGSILLLNKM